MKDYIPHYRLNQPFCLCMHNSFMSLSGGHLNGVLVKSPGHWFFIANIAADLHVSKRAISDLNKTRRNRASRQHHVIQKSGNRDEEEDH